MKRLVKHSTSRILTFCLTALAGIFLAPMAWATPKTISINFGTSSNSGRIVPSDDNDSGSLVSGIPNKAWLNLAKAANNWNSGVTYWDPSASANQSSSATIAWKSATVYQYDSASTVFLKGYLDDGSVTEDSYGDGHASVKVTGIPFEYYDVIIYASTDTANAKFTPYKVNGAYYTWDSNRSAAFTELNSTSTSWGASRNAAAEYGTNALRIPAQSGDLDIGGGASRSNNGVRGGIAAIQIVEAEAPQSLAETGDFVSYKAQLCFKNVSLSDIGTKYDVRAKIAGGFVDYDGHEMLTCKRTEITDGLTYEFQIVDGTQWIKGFVVEFTQVNADVYARVTKVSHITTSGNTVGNVTIADIEGTNDHLAGHEASDGYGIYGLKLVDKNVIAHYELGALAKGLVRNGKYTMSDEDQNFISWSNGAVTQTKSDQYNLKGVKIDWPSPDSDQLVYTGKKMTVFVKYSGYGCSGLGNNSILGVLWGSSSKEMLVNANSSGQLRISYDVTSTSAGTAALVSPRYSIPAAGIMMVTFSGDASDPFVGTTIAFATKNNDDSYSAFKQVYYDSSKKITDGKFYGLKIGGSIAKIGSYHRPDIKVHEVMICGASKDEAIEMYANPAKSSVTFVSPSSDVWADATLPTEAYSVTSGSGTISFANSPEASQVVNSKGAVVANVSGGSFTEIDGYFKWQEVGASTSDVYLLVNGSATATRVNAAGEFDYDGGTRELTGNVLANLSGSASVDHFLGGYKGGSPTALTGNIGLVVDGSAVVKGSIVGGWSSVHNYQPLITGSTKVLVKNVQSLNTDSALDGIPNGYIIGGSSYQGNYGHSKITGNTAVEINLESGASGKFAKAIVGGSYGNEGNAGKPTVIEGNTSVSITAPNDVQFTKNIIGGSWANAGTASVGGTSSVTLDGGTYMGTIYAGGFGNGTPSVAGGATLTLKSGDFSSATFAGGTATGTKSIVIDGNVSVVGANVSGFDSIVINPDKTLTLSGSSDASNPFTISVSGSGSLVISSGYVKMADSSSLASVTVNEGATFTTTAGSEGTVVDNGTLNLLTSDALIAGGYTAANVTGSGTVVFISATSGNTLQTKTVAEGGNVLASQGIAWVGGTDTSWDTAANWNANRVPTSSDVVNIGTVSEAITVTASSVAGSLVVSGNATLSGTTTGIKLINISENCTLGLEVAEGGMTVGGIVGPGSLTKTGTGVLTLNNSTAGKAIDNAPITINNGTVKLNCGNQDAVMDNPSFTLGADGNLDNYGWFRVNGTLTLSSDTEKTILHNGEHGTPACMQGNPAIVKNGSGTIHLACRSIGNSSAAMNPYASVTVNAGTLDFSSSMATEITGAVSGAGALSVSGTGAVTFDSANTLTGAMTIGANSHVIVTGSNAVSGNDVTVNGTLEMKSPSNVDDNSGDYSYIKGSGKILLSGANYRLVPKDVTKLWASTLSVENNLANGLIVSQSGTDSSTPVYEIGTLSGTGNFRSDYGDKDRSVRTTLSADSNWSGYIMSDSYNRFGTLYVASADASDIHTLTISSSTTSQSAPLNIESTGCVNLTGTWKGAIANAGKLILTSGTVDSGTVTGAGTVEIASGSYTPSTVAGGTVLIDSGATFTLPSVLPSGVTLGTSAGTLTLPAGFTGKAIAVATGADLTNLTVNDGTTTYGSVSVIDGYLYVLDEGISFADNTLTVGSTATLAYSDAIFGQFGLTAETMSIAVDAGGAIQVQEVVGDGGVETITNLTWSGEVNVSVKHISGEAVAAADITAAHDTDNKMTTVTFPPQIYGAATSFDATFTNVNVLAYCGYSGASMSQDSTCTYNNNLNDTTTGVYLKHHPHLNGATQWFANTDEITLAVVGTMTADANKIFLHMGSTNTSGGRTGYGLLLLTGENANEVVVAWNNGATVTKITTMTVPYAATQRHTYIVTKKDVDQTTTFTIYLDGVKWTTASMDKFTITGGFQVGADYGEDIRNAGTYTAVTADDGVINVMRAYDRVITPAEIEQYKIVYPYENPVGNVTRTVTGSGNSFSAEGQWYQGETALETALPTTGADITITASDAATIDMNADFAASNVTLDGAGSLTITSSEGALTASGMVAVNVNTTVKYGAASFAGSPVMVGDGKTLTFDFSDYDFTQLTENVTVALTGSSEPNQSITVTGSLLVAVTYDTTTSQYKATLSVPKASIGDVQYPSLQAAIDALTVADQTITALAEGEMVTSAGSYAFTLNLNGYTVYPSVLLPDVTVVGAEGEAPGSVHFYDASAGETDMSTGATIAVAKGTDASLFGGFIGTSMPAFKVETGIVKAFYAYKRTVEETDTYYATAATAFNGISEGDTVTLVGNVNESSMAITVPAGVTLDWGSYTLTASSITGGTTACIKMTLSGASSAIAALQDGSKWTGVVELSGNASNANVDFNHFGNSESTVRANGLTCDFKSSSVGTLDIGENGLIIDGSYSAATVFTTSSKLTGTGMITIQPAGNGNKTYKFSGDVTEFAGSISYGESASNARVTVGTSSDGPSYFVTKTINVMEDGEAVLAAGATWTAPGGYVVNGHLTVRGSLLAGSTAKTIYGSGCVTFDGVVQTLYPGNSFTGTNEIIDVEFDTIPFGNFSAATGSTLKFKGVSGACGTNSEFSPTFVLENSETSGKEYGLKITNGWNNNLSIFTKISGSGTIVDAHSTDKTCEQRFVFKDASEYTGSIVRSASPNAGQKRFIFSAAGSVPGTAAAGTVIVMSDGAPVLGDGAGWTDMAGISISGNVIMQGAATMGSAVTLNDGATLTFNGVAAEKRLAMSAAPTFNEGTVNVALGRGVTATPGLKLISWTSGTVPKGKFAFANGTDATVKAKYMLRAKSDGLYIVRKPVMVIVK